MVRAAIIAAIFVAAPSAVSAQSVPNPSDGNGLYSFCTSSNVSWQNNCLLYIVGAVDAFRTTQALSGTPPLFCLPAGVINNQLMDVVVVHLRDNPQYRNLGSSLLILGALTEAFPCAPQS